MQQLSATRTQRAAAVGAKVDRALAVTYRISSADLDVGEVRFWCTLATPPQE